MLSTNIEMLQTVAIGLGELKDEVVFVGGAVAELYADNPAASDIRPTKDVDCVIELKSRMEHARLEENLRTKGFEHDTSKDAPICRMIHKNIKVDVMPTDEDIIYIVDNCTELLNDIRNANTTVKTYLKEESQGLLENDNLTEGVESSLPYGSGEEGTDIILELIQSIAEIE